MRKMQFIFFIALCVFIYPVAVQGQTSLAQTQELKPFDINQEKLPTNYYGFSPFVIKLAIASRFTSKDEFETTEQYISRKKQMESRPLIGSVNIDSLIAFRLLHTSRHFAYDADRQIIKAEIRLSNSRFELGIYANHNYYIEIKNKSDFDFHNKQESFLYEKELSLET